MNTPNKTPPIESGHAPEQDPNPTTVDWYELQGGLPEVWVSSSSKSLLVVHAYEGKVQSGLPKPDGANVTTAYKEVITPYRVTINGRLVVFPSLMVWALHGGPCSAQSEKLGGGSYDRVKDYNDPSKPYRTDLTNRGYHGPYKYECAEIDGQPKFVLTSYES